MRSLSIPTRRVQASRTSQSLSLALIISTLAFNSLRVQGAAPPPPTITGLTNSGSQSGISWDPSPGAVQYKVFRSDSLSQPFLEDISGTMNGFSWSSPMGGTAGFYRLQAVPMSDTELFSANVLNRIAYGPTPDELERVRTMGPDAYINEQLAPELISENLDIDRTGNGTNWQQVVVTGTATGTNLYIYLNSPGQLYLDDIMLVRGTNPATGPNLIVNGAFESAFVTGWKASTNYETSTTVPSIYHSGSWSLRLVATSATAGSGTLSNSVWQSITAAISSGQTYTLSYWYLPPKSGVSDLTIRLSGSGITSSPDTVRAKLDAGLANIDDLRAWHVLRALKSRRQLLEVLDQFLENHFVTQYDKSRDYFDQFYSDGENSRIATLLEFKENQQWRQALLDPACTFHDLLSISAKSPAMIIYLDTVSSRGDGSNIANENYARELLELFCNGVDNGYDQNDIVAMSKVWTGWRVRLVHPTNEFNPFALQSSTIIAGSTNLDTNVIANLEGVWAFNYRSDRHNNSAKTIFPGKTVPARFGVPWSGRNYELALPAQTGTNTIQEGYQAIAHLANLPFTSEFISVKLCRLFVHDDFHHGVYDYTDPNLSEEGQLVRQCMLAWENGSPKGQIRDVLRVIFASDLFRSHGGSMQKVKTPIEFTVSAVRALRANGANGTVTADTDGYSLRSPMSRMGSMSLFNRVEPDGYPESAAPWISAGTLSERLRFVQSFLTGAVSGRPTDAGNSSCNPVALIQLKLPSTSWQDPAAVADYFLGILFPAEGRANLDVYRTQAIAFLNDGSADSPANSTPFSSLTVSATAGSAYDTRVRGMVAALMTTQRFHEQ